jgi:glycosyltransferase involved in cell wall biosynthesis
MASVCIGIHVHAEPERLERTLASVRAHAATASVLLLPDGPDEVTRVALQRIPLPQMPSGATLGPPACFNRLAQACFAEVFVLLESGAELGPGSLESMLAALHADPANGLAGPSTNRSWNEQGAFSNAAGTPDGVAQAAMTARQRFGTTWKSLEPLYSLADFCYMVRHKVFEVIGPADEAYGLGPCWEMDYNIRAARAGFRGVWACGAYVHREPPTMRRTSEENLKFPASKQRYQDKFCGLRLRGHSSAYAGTCRGDGCRYFAPDPPFGCATPQPGSSDVKPIAIAGRWPLVSCIMPTADRPDWLQQAIRYFQAQDYAERELVIVDASAKSLGAMIPDDARIRHVRVPPGKTIGAMRNLACELAHGDIIVHWDDDDWYGPDRISAQVQPIVEGRADITGLTDTTFFELPSWTFWRCSPELHQRMFVQDVHGGTLAFRRSLFGADCRYPDRSLAEDAEFLLRAVRRGGRIERLPGDGLFVYVRHGRNAWSFPCGRHVNPSGWRRDTEPCAFAHDRDFYLAHSRPGIPGKPLASNVAIGVYVHAEPDRLHATLAALRAHTVPGFELWLLPDGPDPPIRAKMRTLADIPRSATEAPRGAAACFNRLTRISNAETVVLLESGTIVGPGWLEPLLAALAADARHGLASPSTNRAWNQLAEFADGRGDESRIVATATEAARRFGHTWRSLAPLWDVGDFCLAVRRAVIDAVGPADESYGQGPCWEMDYAVRAVRAGFVAVWAPGSYVFRHPFTDRRRREEARLFETSRRRYQDKFCGLRLAGRRLDYATSCRGDACPHFAAPVTSSGVKSQPRSQPQRGDGGSPLVSCIMPTAGRRRFVPSAIRQFLDQDQPNKELIIIDDGQDPVDDLIPADDRIRYFRQAGRRTIGAKRNSACAAARGQFIAHWDDDDWYRPWRLSYQLAELQSHGAALCGLANILFLDEEAQRAWEYTYPPGGTPWVYGATFCYRRDLWERNPFPDIDIGEDTRFVFASSDRGIQVLERRDFFVGRIHPGNISPKRTRDRRWRPVPYEGIRTMLGEGLSRSLAS